MKSRLLLAWLVVGVALTISRLAAQDVTVTDPAWFDPENAPADQKPQFKKRPKVDFPDELKNPEQVAYAIVGQVIDEKGNNLSWVPQSTNPHIGKVLKSGLKYSPAVRAGKAVVVSCWFGVIFNPRSASLKRKEASPRLLAVTPIVVEEKTLAPGGELPSVIWATVNLDEKGALQTFNFDEPAHEMFRPRVRDSLHRWQFAPARRGGQAVAAALHVPLILMQFFELKMDDVLPKVLFRAPPVYPFSMVRSNLRGEVLMEFIVDENGLLKNPVVIQSNNPGFNEAALEALMKWKYAPGRKGGKLVSARMQQTFVFDIEGSAGRDLVTIEKPSDKQRQKLPAELQYDVAPKQKNVLHAIYPYSLLCDRVEGSATVATIVDDKGKVVELLVKEASRPEFGLALTAAVETYEFIPALKGGKPSFAGLKYKQDFDKVSYGNFINGKEEELLAVEKKHPEKILSVKKLDRPLKPISQKSPVFPCALKGRYEHGEAMVEFLIDEEGFVRLPRIRSATDQAFGYAAVQAIAAWRFEAPTTAGGRQAIAHAIVPFVFNLRNEATEQSVEKAEESIPAEKK